MTIAEKENIKAYIKAVRVEMDNRNAAKFASSHQIAVLKNELAKLDNSDIDTSEFVKNEDGKGLSEQNYSTADAAILHQLASDANSGFTAEDVLDIFN